MKLGEAWRKAAVAVLLLLAIVLAGCVKNNVLNVDRSLDTSCIWNRNCEWISKNCCPPTSGAHWECMNPNKFDVNTRCDTDTNGNIIPLRGDGCNEIDSPKPEDKFCRCVKQFCTQVTVDGAGPEHWR